MRFHLFFLSVIAFAFFIHADLSVQITVKEPSGFAADNFPVTAMVPVPYGIYQNTASMRLRAVSSKWAAMKSWPCSSRRSASAVIDLEPPSRANCCRE